MVTSIEAVPPDSTPESVEAVIARVPEIVALPSVMTLVQTTCPVNVPPLPLLNEKTVEAPFIDIPRFRPLINPPTWMSLSPASVVTKE